MNQAEHYQKLGLLIDAVGTNQFPVVLADWLRLAVPYSHTVAFCYGDAVRPVDIYDDFPASKRKIFVTDYLEGPYLLDPFFRAAMRPAAEGLYRLRDLAPDRFYQGEYYRSYYAQTGLAEEIGFFVPLGTSATIVLSLMRAERVFSARDFRSLQDLAPVVLAAMRRHWTEHPALSRSPTSATETKVEKSFANFGRGLLTPREREIVEHTLKGNSADATGEILGISSGTVRIHRRNVYAKLQISSQGELFSKFIQTLSAA